jgi:surfactin synthase thioesterase subunit
MSSQASRWIMRFHPSGEAPVRLVVFPHAGGAASFYHPLSARFAPDADVVCLQYPGRQDRRQEPCITDIGELADRVAGELLALGDKPTVFFGHSMGAVLAFETALRLERAGRGAPRALVVSGRRAPSRYRRETVHRRDDDGILAEIKRLGGTDLRLLDDELLRIALPSIRGDYQAIETYVCEPGQRVRCPVVVLTGDADPVTTLDEAEAWQEHTDGQFRISVLPGGHFFLTAQQDEVCAEIARQTRALALAPAR